MNSKSEEEVKSGDLRVRMTSVMADFVRARSKELGMNMSEYIRWIVEREMGESEKFKKTKKTIRTHCKGMSKMDIPTNGGTEIGGIRNERDSSIQ